MDSMLEHDGLYSLGPYRIMVFNQRYVYLRGNNLLEKMGDFNNKAKPIESYFHEEKGASAFILAAASGHIELLKLHIKNNFHRTVHFSAGAVSPLREFRFLVNVYGNDIFGPPSTFYKHLINNNLGVIEYMLSQGIELHKGPSALNDSCICGHLDMVKLLVSNGAPISKDCINTALKYKNGLEIAKYLIPLSREEDRLNLDYDAFASPKALKYLISQGYPIILNEAPKVHLSVVKYLLCQASWVKTSRKEINGLIQRLNFYDDMKENIHDYERMINFIKPKKISLEEAYQQLKTPKFVNEDRGRREINILFIRALFFKL